RCLSVSHGMAHVVPNPVNTETYRPDHGPVGKEIMIVGRLEQRKGTALFIDAIPDVLHRCPGSTFHFFGSEEVLPNVRPWRERLLEKVPKEEQSRVHFHLTNRDELIRRYQRAAVSVMPSVWESLCYALQEAMACGVPAIGTRVGGIPELIEDGVTGL